MHLFNKPCLFKTDFEQAQKPSLCKVVYRLWQFSRDFTDIKSGESFDTERNLFSVISRQNECMQKYCSADFQLAVRFETL